LQQNHLLFVSFRRNSKTERRSNFPSTYVLGYWLYSLWEKADDQSKSRTNEIVFKAP
jgi:hypothetical protein